MRDRLRINTRIFGSSRIRDIQALTQVGHEFYAYMPMRENHMFVVGANSDQNAVRHVPFSTPSALFTPQPTPSAVTAPAAPATAEQPYRPIRCLESRFGIPRSRFHIRRRSTRERGAPSGVSSASDAQGASLVRGARRQPSQANKHTAASSVTARYPVFQIVLAEPFRCLPGTVVRHELTTVCHGVPGSAYVATGQWVWP